MSLTNTLASWSVLAMHCEGEIIGTSGSWFEAGVRLGSVSLGLGECQNIPCGVDQAGGMPLRFSYYASSLPTVLHIKMIPLGIMCFARH